MRFYLVYSNPTFINVAFIGNQSSSFTGGPIYIQGECTSLLVNCVFVGNSGNAITERGMSEGGLTTLYSCTITGNLGYAIENSSGTHTDLTNSILWGNGSGDLSGYIGKFTLRSCCLADGEPNGTYIPPVYGWGSPIDAAYNCIDYNPRFVRAPNDGGDGWGIGDNDDFGDMHLSYLSPCIDAGNNTFVPADIADLNGDGNITELTPLDFDNKPRFYNDPGTTDTGIGTPPIVDMGAYEFQGILGDLEPDGDVDYGDLLILTNQWLQSPGSPSADIAPQPNGDNIVDFRDFALLAQNWFVGIEP